MSDNGTLRDHLADIIIERNELLRQVEQLQKRLDERNDLLRQVELLKQRIDELTNQYGKLWKVYDPE